VLDDLLMVRRAALLRSFTDALTRGGSTGIPRPIEMYAHDAIRYTGDMLAWVHQATCNERELLDQLLDDSEGFIFSFLLRRN
jgi:hypothetical protein